MIWRIHIGFKPENQTRSWHSGRFGFTGVMKEQNTFSNTLILDFEISWFFSRVTYVKREVRIPVQAGNAG